MPSLFKKISQSSSVFTPRERTLLLIPSDHRQGFFFVFTFMTILGWVGGGIASLALEKILRENIPPDFGQNEILWYRIAKLIASSLFALIFAADQSIPLSKYISGWFWMLATAIGWLFANTVSTAWIAYISSIAASTNQISPQAVTFFGILSTVAYIVSGLWLGLLQWLMLRYYIKDGWWWIFVPSISYLFISISILLVSFLQDFIPAIHYDITLFLLKQGLTALILGVVPAIGFLRLRKNNYQ
ncbi:MAG: hypothetical protein AAF915_17170 [Cyanobacteria bacterium P01_D01_bin.50]